MQGIQHIWDASGVLVITDLQPKLAGLLLSMHSPSVCPGLLEAVRRAV